MRSLARVSNFISDAAGNLVKASRERVAANVTKKLLSVKMAFDPFFFFPKYTPCMKTINQSCNEVMPIMLNVAISPARKGKSEEGKAFRSDFRVSEDGVRGNSALSATTEKWWSKRNKKRDAKRRNTRPVYIHYAFKPLFTQTDHRDSRRDGRTSRTV